MALKQFVGYLRSVKDKILRVDNLSDFVILKNNQKIYLDPSDQRAQKLLRTQGDSHPENTQIWKELVGQVGWTHILDIGANYGEMLLNVKFSSENKVLAIEPNPYVYRYLKKSLKDANIKCLLLPYAIAEANTEIKLTVNRTWSGHTSICENSSNTSGHRLEHIKIKALSLETLLEKYVPESQSKVLIKIDIEGAEMPVLKASLKCLSNYARVAILIEVIRCQHSEICWIFDNFIVYALDLETNTLVRVDRVLDYNGAVATKKYYNRDLVALVKGK